MVVFLVICVVARTLVRMLAQHQFIPSSAKGPFYAQTPTFGLPYFGLPYPLGVLSVYTVSVAQL